MSSLTVEMPGSGNSRSTPGRWGKRAANIHPCKRTNPGLPASAHGILSIARMDVSSE
jgi:hypothetical protein